MATIRLFVSFNTSNMYASRRLAWPNVGCVCCDSANALAIGENVAATKCVAGKFVHSDCLSGLAMMHIEKDLTRQHGGIDFNSAINIFSREISTFSTHREFRKFLLGLFPINCSYSANAEFKNFLCGALFGTFHISIKS